MARAYPVRLIPDDNNTIRVEFPDFPEAHTFGKDKDQALERAVGALETVIGVYIRDGRVIPSPGAACARDATVVISRS